MGDKINVASGKVLDVFAAWKNWPARVNQQPSNASAAQKWVIQDGAAIRFLFPHSHPCWSLILKVGVARTKQRLISIRTMEVRPNALIS